MDKLRDRFAALDRVSVPDVWGDVLRRAETLPQTAGAQPAVVLRRRQAADHGHAPRLSLSPMMTVLITLALLVTLVAGGLAVGSWLNRKDLSVVLPPSPSGLVPTASVTPTRPGPTPSARPTMAGLQEGANGSSWTGIPCAAEDSTQPGQPSMPVGPAPAGTPSPGAIAFQDTSPGGASRVALLDPTSGDVTPITPPLHDLALADSRFNPGDFFVTDLSWSPDGRALHFQLHRSPGINVANPCGSFVVSADGATLRRLEPAGFEHFWAPDGSRIAVRKWDGSIAVVPLDGSAVTELGNPVRCGDEDENCTIQPAGWSPDGELIATTFVAGLPNRSQDTGYGVAVFNMRDASWTILSTSGWSYVMRWLPDGSVAARHVRANRDYALHPDRPGEATLLPFVPRPLGDIAENPSPDGSHDLFLPADLAGAIRVHDLVTGDLTSTIAVPAPIYRLSIPWSPDSAQLAFVTEEGLELWTVSVDGSNLRRVGTAGGNVLGQPGDLAWQPVWP